MSQISKHYPEQKRKRDTCVQSGINLFVRRHTVCVDYFLKNLSKVIRLDVCRWGQLTEFDLLNLDVQKPRVIICQQIGLWTIESLYELRLIQI